MKVSVLIPTNVKDHSILPAARSASSLKDVEVIVMTDSWHNIAKVRNALARASHGAILAFIDHDVSFRREDFEATLKLVREGTLVLNSTSYFMTRKDFFERLDGYDERICWAYTDDVEFVLRARRMGLEVISLNTFVHLGGSFHWQGWFYASWNLVKIYMDYFPKELLMKMFSVRSMNGAGFSMNPLRFLSSKVIHIFAFWFWLFRGKRIGVTHQA